MSKIFTKESKTSPRKVTTILLHTKDNFKKQKKKKKAQNTYSKMSYFHSHNYDGMMFVVW